MAFPTGILSKIAAAPLARRFAWVTAARLAILAFLLGLMVLLGSRGGINPSSFTVQLGSVTLAVAFALTALTAWLSRVLSRLTWLVNVHLCMDQAIWTVVVYLSGAAASGATSFYGLSCLTGAVLAGTRGAAVAALAGVLGFGSLLIALGSGWLPPPPDQPPEVYLTSTNELLYVGIVNGLVMVVVTLLAGTLTERLRATGGKLVRAEQRAEDAERMAAMGRLAAGLAHEIRNPLGSIAGSIRLLRSNQALSDEDRQLCDIIHREASRLNELVTDMVDLSRPRVPSFAVVDAASTTTEVVKLASVHGRGSSDVRVEYRGPASVRIWADPGQLKQMIWNLVRNAVQASGADDTVLVQLRVGGDHAQLAVIDHGVGFDAAALDQIFDAFFTTRSQGTGIGLAVVKRIADAHGFLIDVESEQGRGASFKVDLGPVRQEPVGTRDVNAGNWTLNPGSPG